jgi:hypothetical protein
MSAVQWFSGPPPAVGWWPASVTCNFVDIYRWWDGFVWSTAVFHDATPIDADLLARQFYRASYLVKWRHWSIDIDGTDGRGAHE